MVDDVDAKNLSEAERLLDLMSFLYHNRKTSYRELENRYGIKATAITRAKNKLIDLFDVPFENESGRHGYIKVEDGWRPPVYSLTSRQEFSLGRVVSGGYEAEDIEVLKTILEDFGHC